MIKVIITPEHTDAIEYIEAGIATIKGFAADNIKTENGLVTFDLVDTRGDSLFDCLDFLYELVFGRNTIKSITHKEI